MITFGASERGERLKAEAHALLEARREAWLWRARRALIMHLLRHGTATADDVAESIGPNPDGIDPRWRGAVPKPLVLARIIQDSGRLVKSIRPEAHARKITVWEPADRLAALAWLASHPEIDEPDGDAGSPCPVLPTSPIRPELSSQPTLF